MPAKRGISDRSPIHRCGTSAITKAVLALKSHLIVIWLIVSNYSQSMPKLKTRKAAAKRFRATGSGKIRRRKAFKNHMLEHKTSQRKRRLSQLSLVNERDADNVRLMLPYL